MRIQKDRNEWVQLIAEWKISGQSQREFCRVRQLSYRSFLKRRRREEGDAAPTNRSGKLRAVALAPPLLSLLPELAMELDIVSLVIPVSNGKATVTVNGKVSIAQLGRLAVACKESQGHYDAPV